MNKSYTFNADEGFQAIMLELIGKNSISSADYDKLIRGLLIDAYNRSKGEPILITRTRTFIVTDPFNNKID